MHAFARLYQTYLLLKGLYTDFSTRTQFFLIEIECIMNMHIRIFIETQRAGQILSIHTQAYLALAAPVELIEGMSQKCEANPTLAPGTAYTQRIYPPEFRIIMRLRAAEADTSDLVAIHGEEP